VTVAETSFDVRYDGTALADGRMAVRDLAPALLALGDLFVAASRELHPEREPVGLNIKATNEGSFLVQMCLEGAWENVVDLFSGDVITAVVNLKEVVIGGAAGWSVLEAIKRIAGRRIAKREQLTEPGMVRLTLEDGTTLEFPSEIVELIGSVEVRKSARQVVRPLERDGIDLLEFIDDESVTVRIQAADVPKFDLPAVAPEVMSDDQLTLVLTVASPNFVEGNKWRFTDGDRSWPATMGDDAFLSRVDAGEKFAKGDMLRCRVRILQQRNPEGGLHTDYQVVEVLEHIPREVQMRLDDGPTI